MNAVYGLIYYITQGNYRITTMCKLDSKRPGDAIRRMVECKNQQLKPKWKNKKL